MIFTANPDGSPALAEPMTKTCRVCARALPLEQMRRHKSGRYGRDTICRECARERRAARRVAGLCVESGCPERAAPGRSQCADHLAAFRAYAHEERAARRETGLCSVSGCPAPRVEGRGGYCNSHADEEAARKAAARAADPVRYREYDRARAARLAARTEEQIAADLAAVLAKSPDGLLPCRAGHRAPAEDFHVNRTRLSGRQGYCRAHAVESVARRRRAPHLPSWEDRDLYACTYCGAEYEHADHLLARRNGGPDVSANLAPACARCNTGKGATPVDEWLDRLAAAGDPRGVAREVWQSWPRVYLAVTEDGTVVDVETGEVVEEGAA